MGRVIAITARQKKEALAAFKKSFGSFKGFVKKEWTIEQD